MLSGVKVSNLMDRFNEVVDVHGDEIALKDSTVFYTYRDLKTVADRVGSSLLEMGVRRGDRVGVYMNRSLDTVVSILGVLSMGGAYVPLDPSHPDERNKYILEDSGCRVLIVADDHLEGFECVQIHELKNGYVSVFVGDSGTGMLEGIDDLAYLIYTSGTTGKPKGTLLGDTGVLNLADWMKDEWGVKNGDVVLQFATYSFDASVMDTFGALLNGATLYLLEDEARKDPGYFSEVIVREGVTIVPVLPTVFFNQLNHFVSEESFDQVRVLGVGGEALPFEMAKKFKNRFEGTRLFNLYGPTEITVVATAYEFMGTENEDDFGTVPIGYDLSGISSVVVGDDGNVVTEVGSTGELLIGAVGISYGYLNNIEKTEEVFINGEAFGNASTLYRSGDIVKILSDGSYEFVDRKDLQVKIRGHRIEIGEIESKLMALDGIRDAVVVLDKSSDELVGFYTSFDGELIDLFDVELDLPSYMVPSRYESLDEVPMTPTGKVDRKYLASSLVGSRELTLDVSGMTDTEAFVAEVWMNVLKTDRIESSSNFFNLGGNSIKVIEALSKLKTRCVKISISDFFNLKVLSDIAEVMDSYNQENSLEDDSIEDMTITRLTELPVMKVGRVSRIGRVLLTGSTGFLGSHVLNELVKRDDVRDIYVLVREGNGLSAEERVRDVYRGYFGEELPSNVVVLEGDMTVRHLGLETSEFLELACKIDAVVHCAADVRHFGEREHFEKVNVEGTRNLMDLTELNESIEFHHVSTVGVVEDIYEDGYWDGLVDTNVLGDDVKLSSVYTDTKLDAERLVFAKAERGLPVRVYRMGNLTGRVSDGLFQKNISENAFYRSIKLMRAVGYVPSLEWGVDITPVDFAARVIVDTLLDDDQDTVVRHVCNNVELPFNELATFVGVDVRKDVTKSDYDRLVMDASVIGDDSELQSLGISQVDGDGIGNVSFVFDSTDTLRNCEYVPKNMDDYISRMVKYAEDVGYL